MTCLYFRSLIDDLTDHELSPSLETSVRDHLGVCPACQEEYERSVRLKGLLSELSCPEPEPGYWQESASLIQARAVDLPDVVDLTSEIELRSRQRVSFFRSLAAAAASLLLFLGTLLIDSPWGSPAPISTGEPSYDIELTEASARPRGGGYILEDERALIARSFQLVSTPGMAMNRSSLLSSDGR